MKAENKLFIKTAVLSGLLYAVLMAGFEYSVGEGFKIMKFVFHAVFFGSSMGLLSRYNYKKEQRKAAKHKDESSVK